MNDPIERGLIESRFTELHEWWVALAREEADKVVPKAIEYGADDLIEIGRQMAEVMGLGGTKFDQQQLAELGIYFYVVGKVARWTSAIRTCRAVSDDTLHDIGVYIRMAQRVRSHGGWPGLEPRNVQVYDLHDPHPDDNSHCARCGAQLIGRPPGCPIHGFQQSVQED